MPQTIRMGISTCPNDTFAFHAILNNKIDLQGLSFEIELCDVQELNESIMAGHYDVAKASFHAALLCTEETIVLASGSALGFGVGPVLLSHHENKTPEQLRSFNPLVLCPGQLTTATLLYRMFHDAGKVEQVVFSDIMPRLENASADFGVCIHEGRFSFRQHGLQLVEDLGQTWENTTRCPLPLGGILGQRTLGDELLNKVQSLIKCSIEYAHQNRKETVATMKQYAQEFSEDVLFAHVDLYVNQWTSELGDVGRDALSKLGLIAKQCNLVDSDRPSLEVFESSR